MAIPSGRNFATCYMDLCKQQHLRPLPVISVTLPHSLDFTTDRVKMDDWGPILNSLSLDHSLRSITVRSRYQSRKPLEEINSEDKARSIGKAPVVLTRYLLEWFSHSVSQCVRNSPNLTSLELEGIPFPPDCLAVLCVGLAGTESLQHLSLQRCYIGDSGCELICRTVADVQSVSSLNLSHCDLTSNCGPALAAALSRQKLSLYHDTWKQSLRYREPNLEAMPGLRRLTLNDNPNLGDSAVLELIEAIRDSLWLKALDLRHCGLTDRIGKDLTELLDHNSTLVVLDVRLNANLNDEIVQRVMKRLEENNAEGKLEYKWLDLPQKDRRTASAGTRRKDECDDAKKARRPRSAANIYAKRPCQPSQTVPPKKQSATMNNKRTKMRPPIPSLQEPVEQRLQQKVPTELPPRPRASIHLDLQAQIQSVVEQIDKDVEGNISRGSYVDQLDQDMSSSGLPSIHSPNLLNQSNENEIDLEIKIEDTLKQLAEARAEHDRLLEETKRNDLLLAEERARREVAESNLKSLQRDLLVLEESLREKEHETKGYLLVSQQSLDEICTSFDRLLEMLESVTRNPLSARNELTENVKADIRQRVASVIRKTKSENLRRSFNNDVKNVDSTRFLAIDGNNKKFTKSDSDVRTVLPPLSHLEKKIGDSPDIVSPTFELDNYRRCDLEKLPMSHAERARAIFARIISGEVLLDLGSHAD